MSTPIGAPNSMSTGIVTSPAVSSMSAGIVTSPAVSSMSAGIVTSPAVSSMSAGIVTSPAVSSMSAGIVTSPAVSSMSAAIQALAEVSSMSAGVRPWTLSHQIWVLEFHKSELESRKRELQQGGQDTSGAPVLQDSISAVSVKKAASEIDTMLGTISKQIRSLQERLDVAAPYQPPQILGSAYRPCTKP